MSKQFMMQMIKSTYGAILETPSNPKFWPNGWALAVHSASIELLQDISLKDKNPNDGICAMIHNGVMDYFYKFNNYHDYTKVFFRINSYIKQYMEKWPKFSGNNSYPVPSPIEGEDPGKIFIDIMDSKDSEGFWVCEYGALRIELLNFVIEEMKKDLETIQLDFMAQCELSRKELLSIYPSKIDLQCKLV